MRRGHSGGRLGGSLAGHGTLDVVRGVRQVRGQVDQLAVLVYVENIFNPHAQFFLRDVDARLESKHRSRTERNVIVIGIVDIQADVVTQAMDKIFAQRLAVQVFAMGIDLIVGHIVERIRLIPPQP